ncbi:hypothetical protein BDF14DRAFT_277753 [Spinellus fusiger]|nr:hypothetical protein BDF14DRAFT_277753 [Spinellus fusiger]
MQKKSVQKKTFFFGFVLFLSWCVCLYLCCVGLFSGCVCGLFILLFMVDMAFLHKHVTNALFLFSDEGSHTSIVGSDALFSVGEEMLDSRKPVLHDLPLRIGLLGAIGRWMRTVAVAMGGGVGGGGGTCSSSDSCWAKQTALVSPVVVVVVFPFLSEVVQSSAFFNQVSMRQGLWVKL